jgi:hypothetical protein
VVEVKDETTESYQPVGKQFTKPGGIWYTPSTGIWQTVWMEKVYESYFKSYRVIPDIDKGEVIITVDLVDPDNDDRIEITILGQNREIATETGNSDQRFVMKIDNPHLWTPSDPFLYDLKIRAIRNSKPYDAIQGYFGMRKISLGKDEKGITRMMLNNEFVFQNGPLDQGFWPDGLNTPPSDEAMKYDPDILKKMGFNMLRKHVKVEPRRYYYHTDKMGLLVWQDMPSMFYGYASLPKLQDKLEEAKRNFENELTELIHDHYNSPSIIMWVPFNEGWGQYDTERIANMVKYLDTTRLVNEASGWTDHGSGDIKDIHNYPEPRAPKAEEKRAIVLGEFGGLGLMTPGHMWKEENWGYEKMQNVDALLDKYENFYLEIRKLVEDPGLSAVIYTQTTDVETETNGLMTYDRDRVKMGIENIARAHAGRIPPRLKTSVRMFTQAFTVDMFSPAEGAEIRYTLDGSGPASQSVLFTQPFNIDASTTIRAKSFWSDGDTSRTAVFEIKKVTPAPAVAASAKPGLNVLFYSGNWNKLPDFTILSPIRKGITNTINLSFARTDSLFGLVFEGYLDVPETGVYQIFLSSDDGGRIYLDNQVLIDYDGIHGAGEMSAPAALEKGLHPLKLIYFQRRGGLGLKVSWEGPGLAKEEIGAVYLKR